MQCARTPIFYFIISNTIIYTIYAYRNTKNYFAQLQNRRPPWTSPVQAGSWAVWEQSFIIALQKKLRGLCANRRSDSTGPAAAVAFSVLK
jgi:hypothetical protein